MRRLLPAVLSLTVFAASCGSSTDQVPSAPTLAPASVVETFTGTLAVMGSNAHNFITHVPGRLTITLTSVGPSPVSVGIGLGVPSGLSCVLSLGAGTTATVQAGATPQISGTVLAGTFCVDIFDTGTLTAPVPYSLTVAHP